jgi:hypothetical protein
VLQVVEDKQQLLLGEEILEALGERDSADLPEPECLRDRGEDELGIGDRSERDEEHPLREVFD